MPLFHPTRLFIFESFVLPTCLFHPTPFLVAIPNSSGYCTNLDLYQTLQQQRNRLNRMLLRALISLKVIPQNVDFSKKYSKYKGRLLKYHAYILTLNSLLG